MARPLPPVVYGPLFPESKVLRIGPTLEGALVRLYVDGIQASEGQPGIDGWIAIGASLSEKQTVRATQVSQGEESPLSVDEVVVTSHPDHLSTPEFTSVITNYSSVVALDRLVVGAKLQVARQDGTVVAAVPVERPFQYVRLDLGIPLASEGSLTARQSFNGTDSATRFSPPMRNIDAMIKTKAIPIPVTLGALTACRTDLYLAGLPGHEVLVHNEGRVTSWLVAGEPGFFVDDCQPLLPGKLVVTQEIERVSLKSTSQDYAVGPPQPPRKPEILAPYCPRIQNLKVAGLVPGANVSVFARASSAADWALAGIGRVGAFQEDIPVPAGLIPEGASVEIRVSQDLCGVAGEPSEPVRLGPAGDTRTPRYTEPVIDCANFVLIGDLAAGGRIVLADDQGRPLLRRPHHTVDGVNVVRLARDLAEGETIYGTCTYCDREAEIPKTTVLGIPRSVTTYIRPVKPIDGVLHLADCVVGSRIDIFLNGAFLTYTYPLAKEWTVPLPAQPVLKQTFSILVYVCDRAVTKHAETVRLGQMLLDPQPASLEAGRAYEVVVHAKDKDYGTLVAGYFTLGGSDATGEPISTNNPVLFNVPPDRTAPYSGTVKADGYQDAGFTVAVRQPPRPPKVPTVWGEMQLENGDDFPWTAVFQLTVKGSDFPANTPIKLKFQYRQAKIVGNNYDFDPKTDLLAEFACDGQGNFLQTKSFTLQLALPAPGTPTGAVPVNQGVTVIVESGPSIYNSRYQRPMSQGDSGNFDKVA